MDIISCKEAKLKGLKRYFTGKPCKYGHIEERFSSAGNCCECGRVAENSEKIKKYRKSYAESNREVIRKKQNRRNSDNPERLMLEGAKSRAKARNIEFSITINDIIIPEYCPYFTSIKLEQNEGNRKASDCSPSLDRIDSSKGYIPGNVEVISWRANKLKNDATSKELRIIADRMDSMVVNQVS